MKRNSKAVVLLSGGQDSTTCYYWAMERFSEVYPISFDYGQSHRAELEQAGLIAGRNGHTVKLFSLKDLLAPSSLTTEGGDHNEKSPLSDDLPASFTVGRNLLFLTVAASYAAQVGAQTIVTGVCQTDYSGYPDCRRTTMDAMQLALSLGCGAGDMHILTPLMYLTKAETWKLANELGCLQVIINDTLTDYNGDMTLNEWGRGKADNPASQLRKAGYYEAKEKGWI